MSASNFYNNNALAVYAVGMNDSNIYDYLEDIQETASAEFGFYKLDKWAGESTNYDLHILAGKDFAFSFNGEEFSVYVQLGVRPGYYEGANIDYNITFEATEYYFSHDVENGDYQQAVDNFIDEAIEYNYFAINKGLAVMNRNKLEKAVKNWLSSIVDTCEKVCEMCAQHQLRVYARFPNGETIYSKIQ